MAAIPEGAHMDSREFIAAAVSVAAAATASQAFAQMAAEEPMLRRTTRLLSAREKRGDVSPDKTSCQNSSPM
jgi:hypothetical protein